MRGGSGTKADYVGLGVILFLTFGALFVWIGRLEAPILGDGSIFPGVALPEDQVIKLGVASLSGLGVILAAYGLLVKEAVRECPTCGKRVPSESRYCMHCGAELE